MTFRLLAISILGFNLVACTSTQTVSQPQLMAYAELAADTFGTGPAAGSDNGKGDVISANGRRGPFPEQPIQGISAVKMLANGEFLFLSDNGFGAQANSADYLLSLYRIRFDNTLGRKQANIEHILRLKDTQSRAPFITGAPGANTSLTGAHFDPESLAVTPNGDIWIGDEFGPYMLHFSASGELASSPILTPDVQAGVLSHDSYVIAPENRLMGHPKNLGRTGGFEGMAQRGDMLYPLLEKTVNGDPAGSLRLYQFDSQQKQFTGFMGFYPVDTSHGKQHAIGDITAVNDNQFLVIERDNKQGHEALFKKVFLIDIRQKDSNGFFEKTEVLDLLAINDPQDVNQDGNAVYTMPFVTIESIAVIDKQTVLIANDNNYPFSKGRSSEAIDNTEFAWIRLAKPLQLQ